MVVYEDKNLTIFWEEDQRILVLVEHGFSAGFAFPTGHEQVAVIMRTYHSRKCILDARGMSVLPLRTQSWLVEEWLPALAVAGCRYLAVVSPTETLARLSVERIRQQVEATPIPGTQHQYFDDIDAARDWMRQQV